MAIYSAETRNVVAAALAALLGGSRLFLLSETGRTLAVFPMPTLNSAVSGVIEAEKFERQNVVAPGAPTRWEVRRGSGQVLLSGSASELTITPPQLSDGGLVYIDGFVLTV